MTLVGWLIACIAIISAVIVSINILVLVVILVGDLLMKFLTRLIASRPSVEIIEQVENQTKPENKSSGSIESITNSKNPCKRWVCRLQTVYNQFGYNVRIHSHDNEANSRDNKARYLDGIPFVFRMLYSATTSISSHTIGFYRRLKDKSTKNERNRLLLLKIFQK
jgi:hypothetical protein